MRPLEVWYTALEHGYTEEDVRHALAHMHVDRFIVDKDPPRTEAFGFACNGDLVEMVVLHYRQKDLAIHCMKARKAQLAKALRAKGGRY